MMNSVDDIARCNRRYARPSSARSLGKFGWSVRWLIFIVMYIDRWICDNATHRHHHSQTDKQRTSVFVVEKITKFVNFTYWMKCERERGAEVCENRLWRRCGHRINISAGLVDS